MGFPWLVSTTYLRYFPTQIHGKPVYGHNWPHQFIGRVWITTELHFCLRVTWQISAHGDFVIKHMAMDMILFFINHNQLCVCQYFVWSFSCLPYCSSFGWYFTHNTVYIRTIYIYMLYIYNVCVYIYIMYVYIYIYIHTFDLCECQTCIMSSTSYWLLD